jgi:hypothetical protein
METKCGFCDVGTEFLNIIQTNFTFRLALCSEVTCLTRSHQPPLEETPRKQAELEIIITHRDHEKYLAGNILVGKR